VALWAGLLMLGVAVRLPELWNIPVFTDEWDEIAVSLRILREGARPLTNADPYYGSLTSYLMAGFFLLSGINVEAPRLFALVMGVLQLIPVYLLGLEAGRAAGFDEPRARLTAFLSGLLLASAAGHIVLNSHLAWANSTTPLFTTTGLWLLLRATREWQESQRGGSPLVGAGLCLGLALQTHVMVIVIIIGAAAGALLTAPRLALGRWGVLASGAVALGYVNMIVFNVLTHGESLRYAESMAAGYAGDRQLGYVEKLSSLTLSLMRMLGGAIDRRDSFWAFALDPVLVVGILGGAAGLCFLAIRQQRVLLAVLVATVLLLPYVNNRYEPLFSGRYLSPLLPVLFAGLCITIVLIVGWLKKPGLTAPLGLLCIAGFCAYSLAQLFGLYARLEASGRTNERVLQAMGEVRATLQPGNIVYLDNRLRRRLLMEAGSGDMERVFSALLDVTGTTYEVVNVDDSWRPARPGLVILASRETPRSTGVVLARLQLTDTRGGRAEPMAEDEIFRVYRLPGLIGA
jgi:glycosyltransferase AglD